MLQGQKPFIIFDNFSNDIAYDEVMNLVAKNTTCISASPVS